MSAEIAYPRPPIADDPDLPNPSDNARLVWVNAAMGGYGAQASQVERAGCLDGLGKWDAVGIEPPGPNGQDSAFHGAHAPNRSIMARRARRLALRLSSSRWMASMSRALPLPL